MGKTDFEEAAMTNKGLLEDEIPKRGDDDASKQTVHAKLPRLFPLSCARIYTCHKKDDV